MKHIDLPQEHLPIIKKLFETGNWNQVTEAELTGFQAERRLHAVDFVHVAGDWGLDLQRVSRNARDALLGINPLRFMDFQATTACPIRYVSISAYPGGSTQIFVEFDSFDPLLCQAFAAQGLSLKGFDPGTFENSSFTEERGKLFGIISRYCVFPPEFSLLIYKLGTCTFWHDVTPLTQNQLDFLDQRRKQGTSTLSSDLVDTDQMSWVEDGLAEARQLNPHGISYRSTLRHLVNADRIRHWLRPNDDDIELLSSDKHERGSQSVFPQVGL